MDVNYLSLKNHLIFFRLAVITSIDSGCSSNGRNKHDPTRECNAHPPMISVVPRNPYDSNITCISYKMYY